MDTKYRDITYIWEGYRAAFEIVMHNYSLDLKTGAESVCALKSNYFREI